MDRVILQKKNKMIKGASSLASSKSSIKSQINAQTQSVYVTNAKSNSMSKPKNRNKF